MHEKKLITIMLVLVIIFTNTVISYGAEQNDSSEIRPLYEETTSYMASFVIESNGIAFMDGNLKLKASSDADRVCAYVKITNTATGIIAYNKTVDMKYSSIQKKYVLAEEYQLSTKGRYKMDLPYKCYDASTLLETINVQPIIRTYS